MRLSLVLPLFLLLQDKNMPAPVQATVKRELGDKAPIKDVQKEADGSFTVDTKTASIHVAASGEMISKDETVTLDKTPKAVQDRVARELDGKKLEEVVKVTKVTFEAKSGALKVKVDYDGGSVRRDESVKPTDLPEAVSTAALAKLAGSKIAKAKKILEDGTVRYRVTLQADKKKIEASFHEDGREIPE